MTTWMDKGIRDEVDMAQFATAQVVPIPDPRDARIAELEATLAGALASGRVLNALCLEYERRVADYEQRVSKLELALSPEGDMTITQEELGA